MAILISPMIVPLIISAAGMYFFYSRIGLQGTYWGVVLAHAALGIPFVIITVTATLVGFDRSLTRAAASWAPIPVTTFFKVQMPLILPGRDLGRAVRLHHLLRRGGGGALRGLGGAEDAAVADVHRPARTDQPDDPGRGDDPRGDLDRAADGAWNCCAAGRSGCAACRRADRASGARRSSRTRDEGRRRSRRSGHRYRPSSRSARARSTACCYSPASSGWWPR
jgi:hypothetical protein